MKMCGRKERPIAHPEQHVRFYLDSKRAAEESVSIWPLLFLVKTAAAAAAVPTSEIRLHATFHVFCLKTTAV